MRAWQADVFFASDKLNQSPETCVETRGYQIKIILSVRDFPSNANEWSRDTLFVLMTCNANFQDADLHAKYLYQGVELELPLLLCSPTIKNKKEI